MIFRENIPLDLIDAEITSTLCGTPWHGLVTSDNPSVSTAKLKLNDNSLRTYPLPTGVQKGDFRVARKPGHTFYRTTQEQYDDAAMNHKWLGYAISSGSSNQFYGHNLGEDKFIYLTTTTNYIVDIPSVVYPSSGNYTITLTFTKAFEFGGTPFSIQKTLTIPTSIFDYSSPSSVEVRVVDVTEDGSKVILGFNEVSNYWRNKNTNSRHRKKIPDCYVIFEIIGDNNLIDTQNITTKSQTYCTTFDGKEQGPNHNTNVPTSNNPSGYIRAMHILFDYTKVLWMFFDKATGTLTEVKSKLDGEYYRLFRLNEYNNSTTEDVEGGTMVTATAGYDGSDAVAMSNNYWVYDGVNTLLNRGTITVNCSVLLKIAETTVQSYTFSMQNTYSYYNQTVTFVPTSGPQEQISNTTNHIESGFTITLNGVSANGAVTPILPQNFSNSIITGLDFFIDCGGQYEYIHTVGVPTKFYTPNVYTNNIFGTSMSAWAYNVSAYDYNTSQTLYTVTTNEDGTKSGLNINGVTADPNVTFYPLYTYINGSPLQLHAGKTDYFYNTQHSYNYVENVGSYFNQSNVCYV